MKVKLNFEDWDGYTIIRYYKDYKIFKKVIAFKVIKNLIAQPIDEKVKN